MSDIRLTWFPASSGADIAIDSNDLAVDDGLETACMLSLYTDRRAEDSDVLPTGETDRRGWWADPVAAVAGDRFGSRLWLLDRAKPTQETLDLAVEYAREALQWMIVDLVSNRIDVIAEFIPNGYALQVTVYRPAVDPVTFQFNRNWDAQESMT